jgi:hypothetical protein
MPKQGNEQHSKVRPLDGRATSIYKSPFHGVVAVLNPYSNVDQTKVIAMIALRFSKLLGLPGRVIVIPERFSTKSNHNRTKRDIRVLFINSTMAPSIIMELTDARSHLGR